ncbi:MAG: DUF2282 domain-containing protein [Pseudomonadota bacterium]|nr:DUF2282 domain-containing protein [Pseudomonadota bacterium]
MIQARIFMAIAAATMLTTGVAMAKGDTEKCKVVKHGKGLIKANTSDCADSIHACAGQNKAGDPEAWILVPKGQCKKINAGDFSGVSADIKRKIMGGK